MKSFNSWIVVGVIVVIALSSISAEIHRAKNTPTYQYRLKKPHAGQNVRRVDKDELDNGISKESWFDEKVWGHSRKTWILSCISSALVGTTGIIPLLIIPANCGFNIKSEASSNRMKSLLSFAVGGLLGDVFLHLLPEAWSHVDDYGPKIYGYRHIGMWFLCGLLSFYLVEKLVGGEDDGEEDEKEKDEEDKESVKNGEESVEESSDNDEKMRFSKLIMREREDAPTNKKSKEVRQRKAIKNDDKSPMNDDKGDMIDNDKTSETSLTAGDKGSVANALNGKVIVKDDEEEEEDESNEPEKIKVSGWLNLLANIVDNFTHGLAVAGSYCISPKMGLLTTFAILLHEIPHEIGDFAILLKAGFNRWKAAKAQLMTASGGLIGTLVALSAESVKSAGDVTAWILPFTAGGFVNIAMVTILPDLTNEKNTKESLKQLCIVIAGILVMGLVTALVE